MPIHAGHIALIEFAATQCDEVIVSMSYTDSDPIDHQLRSNWINSIFEKNPCIKVHRIRDDFDDVSLPLLQRTKQWADVIQRVYPGIQCVVSSEEYGEPFAQHLGAQHIMFDKARTQYNISASLIRNRPFKYWHFIPAVVRPYFVKRVCFYGPESTGKSTLTQYMAERYETNFVPELARELITSNDFTVADIIAIGHAQTNRLREKEKSANKILFCDTDVITTQIYANHYLHVVPDELDVLERQIQYHIYFLMDIDVPWVADGLRDLGEHRERMFQVFKDELIKRDIPYILVSGNYKQREETVCREIDRLLNELTT